MINKIVGSYLFVALLFALSIKLTGLALGIDITNVDMATSFMSFLKNCSRELNDFKIAIPTIPKLDLSNKEPIDLIAGIDWLVNFINGFIGFVNILIDLINFLITFLNTLIQLIEFIFIILKNFITMRDSVVSSGLG